MRPTRFSATLSVLLATAAFADTRLNGGGATFPEPLYQRWDAEYAKVRKDVQVDYNGIGSGGGIKSITEKTIDFAASDAPMAKGEIKKAGGDGTIVEFPSCAGAIVPAYNLPGIADLKFTGDVLAKLYLGKITKWNDGAIAELNPGVHLPDTSVTPVYRTDGSGTNFVWTNYLAGQNGDFKTSIGTGKQVKWPQGQGGKGTAGVAAVVQQTPGAIGYVEQNYADKNNLAYGLVKNKTGQFVKASPASVSAAGLEVTNQFKGSVLAANIWDAPSATAYPISSFTYLLVYKDLNNLKTKQDAQAMVDYLWWITHDGQRFAAELDYAPLAPEVQDKVSEVLGTLTYKGQPITPAGKM